MDNKLLQHHFKSWLGHLAQRLSPLWSDIDFERFRTAPSVKRATAYAVIGNALGVAATSVGQPLPLGLATWGHLTGLLIGLVMLSSIHAIVHSPRFGKVWPLLLFFAVSVPVCISVVASGFNPLWGMVFMFALNCGSRMQDWRFHLLGIAAALAIVYALTQAVAHPMYQLTLAIMGGGWIMEWVTQHFVHKARLTKRALAQSTLRMVAHDLATPIARCSLLADALRTRVLEVARLSNQNGQSAPTAESYREILNIANRMQRLMDGIGEQVTGQIGSVVVDLNRIDGGQAQTVDVAQAVTKAVEFQAVVSDLKRTDFTLQFTAHPVVRCEPNLYAAIISNLVGNAIRAVQKHKALQPGDVVVRVCQLPAHGDVPSMAQVSVIDRGVGMTEAEMRSVLEPAQYGKVIREVRPGESHGVGLLVSKSVIKRLGGRIDCSSVKGEGTTFEVTLPTI